MSAGSGEEAKDSFPARVSQGGKTSKRKKRGLTTAADALVQNASWGFEGASDRKSGNLGGVKQQRRNISIMSTGKKKREPRENVRPQGGRGGLTLAAYKDLGASERTETGDVGF